MKQHDEAVDHLAKKLENQGCECIKNERLESRIPDLKCCNTFIEVKATNTDLHSSRTQHQLHDIQEAANKAQKGAILCNAILSRAW
jgi:hypothetical protein